MTDDLYYRKLESTPTIDLVDMIREKDGRIAELEKENAELHVTNKSLLESCEGATMMYEDLCKTKEILHDLANLDGAVHIPMDKVKSLMVKAEKFLKN